MIAEMGTMVSSVAEVSLLAATADDWVTVSVMLLPDSGGVVCCPTLLTEGVGGGLADGSKSGFLA